MTTTEPTPPTFVTQKLETKRHTTSWIEAGPAGGPLMVFVHGWPELGLVWRAQLAYFARAGWRCIAPDMRGYGGSSVPQGTAAYAVPELVADLAELHDALGGAPAVWIGHDWGSPVVWALAAHHPERCRAVGNLCVPYLSKGFSLATCVPLLDRTLYPEQEFPYGQWDYFLYYRESFAQAARDFELDIPATISLMFRRASAKVLGKRARTADVRARNGWFGPDRKALTLPRDTTMLSQADHDALVAAFTRTGFAGADAWYMNDEANAAHAAQAPDGGRLTMPVLFLHATYDATCDTVHSRLAEPMRADCSDLTEVTIDGGHELMLEHPDQVNDAIAKWLDAHGMRAPGP